MTNVTAELTRENPRLLELQAAYSSLNLFEQSVWIDWSRQIDITKFRGENAYIAQRWSMTDERYWATWDYLFRDDADMLLRLGEDGAYGAVVFKRNGHPFSRDLLDSVSEMRFIWDILHFSPGDPMTVLDIGAGYGRLAHRISQAWRGWHTTCVDAVPLSTFVCEYYLKQRQARANVVPLHQLDQLTKCDLACNIQSFSEMPLSAVNFWLDRCVDLDIRLFFLSPHAGDLIHPNFVTSEPNGSARDYYDSFERHGYKVIARRPKFPYGEAPSLIFCTDYIMFERKP
jgi:SAM-dependent methyltransferase